MGIFTPKETPVDVLRPGEVGYMIANIKNTSDVKIGDTITFQKYPAQEPLPGFKHHFTCVFAGIYPIDSTDFEALRDALVKLQLNDSALHIEQESSTALRIWFSLRIFRTSCILKLFLNGFNGNLISILFPLLQVLSTTLH